jgi:uncharacterized protein (DUF302 family)
MWLFNNFGNMQNSPQMQMFNQMMGGKTYDQQMQTIFNMAKSKGIDVNAKIFTEEEARQLGLNMKSLKR